MKEPNTVVEIAGVHRLRKKPVVIEAIQWDGTNEEHVFAFMDVFKSKLKTAMTKAVIDGPRMLIPTLEGVMEASKGDWIIKGVKGEFYPCKPDILAATYESDQAPTRISLRPRLLAAADDIEAYVQLYGKDIREDHLVVLMERQIWDKSDQAPTAVDEAGPTLESFKEVFAKAETSAEYWKELATLAGKELSAKEAEISRLRTALTDLLRCDYVSTRRQAEEALSPQSQPSTEMEGCNCGYKGKFIKAVCAPNHTEQCPHCGVRRDK